VKKISIGIVVLALLAGGVYFYVGRGQEEVAAPALAPAAAVAASRQVVAEAKVVPARSAALSLTTGGTIAEILVKAGDTVQAGQVLLRLDNRHQQAEIRSAEAKLAEAKASYENEKAGATPEEIAAVEAQVRQAQAQASQTAASVSPADLKAAQAAVAQAQAQLAEVEGPPKDTDRRAREATVAQAQQQLQSQRDQLSANKTNAQIQLAQSSDALIQAQSRYSTAKWNWAHVEEHGTDPLNPKTTGADGKQEANKLNNAQKQQYQDAFIQAEAALHSAEQAVQQAQVAYDSARQAEVTGIAASEQAVQAAQAELDKLQAGADAAARSSARAQLAQAQASLDALRGGERTSALDAAQAGVEAAQAQLAQTLAGTPERRLALAQAQITSAEAALEVAKLNLADMELTAPFAGVVAAVDLKANEFVPAGSVAVRLADVSSWQIETTDLTELSVVRIAPDAPVAITFDALPGVTLPGKVTRIEMIGENKQGDIAYTVQVQPDQQDAHLWWNMTASVAIDAH
jgi:HlyD family secretion protein